MLFIFLDKQIESTKDTKSVDKSEREQHPVSTRQADMDKKESCDKDDKGNTSEGRGNGSSTKHESREADDRSKEAQNVEKPDQGEVAGGTPKSGTVKSGKKKIIKKIVKQKAKTVGDAASTKNDQLDEKVDGEKASDIPSDPPSNESAGVKTVAKKKIIKRVGKNAQNEKNKDVLPKGDNEMDCSEDKSKDNSDLNATAGQDTVVKTTVKKKVIKRVPKKKVTAGVSSEEVPKKGEDGDGPEKKVAADETLNVEKPITGDKQENKVPKSKSTSPTLLKRRDSVNLKTAEKEHKKNDNETGKEISPVTNSIDKQKVVEKDSNNGKREKSRDGEQSKGEKVKVSKDVSRSKPNKELKEKRKSEEPPQHPGLILQTKWGKDSKVG